MISTSRQLFKSNFLKSKRISVLGNQFQNRNGSNHAAHDDHHHREGQEPSGNFLDLKVFDMDEMLIPRHA